MVTVIPAASTVQGVARTSREGDRDDQPVRAGRSITLRNGACLYRSQNVATTNTTTVDHAPPHRYPLADMARRRATARSAEPSASRFGVDPVSWTPDGYA